MSEVRTMKGVDDNTWAEFKSIAAQNQMKAGQMFKLMVDEYRKKSALAWDKILNHKSILSKKEIDKFEAAVKKVRKEYGWRI